MSDTEKTIDRCIARLHLRRVMRPYRSSRAFVLLVVMPGDAGTIHWKAAAYDVLKEIARKEAAEPDEYDWRRANRGDDHVDVFDIVAPTNGKEAKVDPWGAVAYGTMRTVLVCRRKDADIVTASKLSALADAVIDIPELDLKLVQRAVKTATGDDVSLNDAAEILALPNEVRDVLRKTGRGIANVLRRIRMCEAVPAETGPQPSRKTEGPRLEDMHGYGAAKEWGLELARDIGDYRAGVITWDDVDSGLLLSGPPGCGKTTFAQALANTCGVELVIGSYSTWQSAGHQGDMLKAMTRTFDRARETAPCILLVDEVDSFVDREKDHHNQDYMRGVVNGFLEQLDGAKDREGVVVIGACNNPDIIDPAVVRSGRLDRHIEIDLPDTEAREHILRYHLQAAIDVSDIISRTEGFSGADLERVARDARRLARRQRMPITIDHVTTALPKMYRLSHDQLLSTAVHELGHAVIGIVLGHRKLKRIVVKKDLVTTATSQSMGYASFETRFAERKTKAWFENEICLCLGSVAVENLFYGGHCDGAAQDLQQATDTATYMIAVAGFGKRLVSEGVGGDLAMIRQRDFRFDPAVDEILREQLERAAGIVERYRDVIEHLTQELAKTGEIDGNAVSRAVLDHGKGTQRVRAI